MMDWILIGAMVVCGWMMLSVLSGERLTRAQYIVAMLAEKAKAKADEIPTARASDMGSVSNSAAGKKH